MSGRALVIGGGGIGRRHLQSLAALKPGLVVVEPIADRREALVRELRDELDVGAAGFACLAEVPRVLRAFDLIVSAVTADAQPEVSWELAGFSAPVVILEKPVAQSAEGLRTVRATLQTTLPGARIFVNCTRILATGYRDLRRRLEGAATPIDVEVAGAAWGYGCNALHFIELFRVLVDATALEVVDARLRPAPSGSRRGPRFEEFDGAVRIVTPRGDRLVLRCEPESGPARAVTLEVRDASGARWTIDEASGVVRGPGGEAPLGLMPVSQSTSWFVERLAEGAPDHELLPTLDASALSHDVLYQSLRQGTGRPACRIT